MNCRSVKNLLSPYLDRELTGHQTLDIRAHLEACPNCRQELESLRRLKITVAELPEFEPTAQLQARLSQIAASPSSAPMPSSTRSWRMPASLAAVAVAATVCAVVAHLALGTPASAPVVETDDPSFQIAADQALMAGADPFSGQIPITLASRER